MTLTQIIIFFALVISPIAALSQGGDFTLQGKVNAKHNGKFLKVYYQNDSTKITDSVVVKNGRFKLEGYVNSPTVGKLSFDGEDTGDRIDLFLSKGTIKIVAKDSMHYARVSGTAMAKTHERLAKKLRPVDREFFDGLNTFRNMPEGEAKKAYFTHLMAGFDDYNLFKRETIHQFLADNPNSYVSLYHLDKTALGRLANYETTYPFYEKLSQELKETPVGKRLGERLLAAKGKLTGQNYKDFVSTTPEGKELSLKEVISENKYTLVDFWASWCGPCRKENPHVVNAFNTFKDMGFTVLSVSLDDNESKWTSAIEQDGMPWHHVSSLKGWKEPAAALYEVRAIPQNFLIDDQGKIVATNLRGETLFNKIQELLK